MSKNKKVGKKLVFILSIDPYEQNVCVVVNGQFKDAYEEIKKHKTYLAKKIVKFVEENQKEYLIDDYDQKSENAYLYTELPAGYVMIIKHCDSWIKTVGLVVHESLHLTHYILRRAGIELTKESEEAFTYLQGNIVERILDKIY